MSAQDSEAAMALPETSLPVQWAQHDDEKNEHTNGGGQRTKRHAGCGPLQRRYETANYGTITSVYTKGPPRDDATTEYDGERWRLKPCTCPCHSRATASAWVRQHEWVKVVDYDAQE